MRKMFSVFFCSLVGIMALVTIVQANMIEAVKTHVYFEKDGIPYNDSVTFTFKCFGTTIYPPNQSNISEVFHYSASCPEYGCAIWQPDYPAWRFHFEYCDLEGETHGRDFIIKNVSPFSSCTRIPAERFYPSSWKSTAWTTESYYFTQEFKACTRQVYHSNRSLYRQFFRTCDTKAEPGCMELFDCIPPVRMISESEIKYQEIGQNSREYIRYLLSCDPVTDKSCPGWVIDGEPLKENEKCRINDTVLKWESDTCRRFGVKVNPDLVLSPEEYRKGWYDNDHVSKICDTRWVIPSDNQTSPESHSHDRYIPKSRVESLYCSILQFLGGRCE